MTNQKKPGFFCQGTTFFLLQNLQQFTLILDRGGYDKNIDGITSLMPGLIVKVKNHLLYCGEVIRPIALLRGFEFYFSYMYGTDRFCKSLPGEQPRLISTIN